jgi:hypothetical protein
MVRRGPGVLGARIAFLLEELFQRGLLQRPVIEGGELLVRVRTGMRI